MPRARSIAPPAAKDSSAATDSSAPKGRNIPAQGNALGSRHPMNPSPEGAAQSPENWKMMFISDFACTSTERVNPNLSRDSPYIGLEHIDKDTGKLVGTGTAADVVSTKSVFRAGDLLYGKLRPYLNKVWIAEFEGFCSTDILVFPKSEAFDNKFLKYRFLSQDFVNYANANSSGVNLPRVSSKVLGRFKINLPPLSEQRRIVARIEELFSRLDAGVAALRHAKAQLQRYRQSVLAAAVTGQLTQAWREQNPDTETADVLLKRILKQRHEKWNGRGKYTEAVSADPLNLDLPATWTITNIDSVISGIEAGKNFKCEERPPTEGETGLVKISAVTWGKFDELESKTVTRGDQIRKEHVIHSGDFLLSRANTLELVGAPVIVDQITRHLMLSDKVLRLRFIDRLERFALFWLRSKLGRKEIESRATGNQLSMRNIAQASLRAIPLPMPPLAEQHQIVAEVEARTTAIDHLEAELDRQITRSNRLRQSTLTSAFAGTLLSRS
jgi:type I restriction enzyme S subunit